MPPKSKKPAEPTYRKTWSQAANINSRSGSEEVFNPNIDLISTGTIPKIPKHWLLPGQEASYSLTKFDQTPAQVADQSKNTNRTVYHSVVMSEHDELELENQNDRDNHEQARNPNPIEPPATPGVSAEFTAMMSFFTTQQQQMQQDLRDQERRQEHQRLKD
jgi:hypothetical protein